MHRIYTRTRSFCFHYTEDYLSTSVLFLEQIHQMLGDQDHSELHHIQGDDKLRESR